MDPSVSWNRTKTTISFVGPTLERSLETFMCRRELKSQHLGLKRRVHVGHHNLHAVREFLMGGLQAPDPIRREAVAEIE
jgi:hypothetical protein